MVCTFRNHTFHLWVRRYITTEDCSISYGSLDVISFLRFQSLFVKIKNRFRKSLRLWVTKWYFKENYVLKIYLGIYKKERKKKHLKLGRHYMACRRCTPMPSMPPFDPPWATATLHALHSPLLVRAAGYKFNSRTLSPQNP